MISLQMIELKGLTISISLQNIIDNIMPQLSSKERDELSDKISLFFIWIIFDVNGCKLCL